MKIFVYFTLILSIAISSTALAKDKIELKTIKIKGNKELPKILYLVPWQESKSSEQAEQKLKLHNFFGDIYKPMSAEAPGAKLKNTD